jgi:DNA ligase D-like protein (predicted polymerase)/DNA ligase D-like protein (predicted 3'-phosphoesterase)
MARYGPIWPDMGLKTYYKKRDFSRTPEPEGKVRKSGRRRFVVQEHHASRLHFDFRLEMEGVLKSWSVPKGPSLDPSDKRLAVETEDHPVDYLKFEGQIEEGNYGAGEVRVWDTGTYEMVSDNDKPGKALKAGKLSFILRGDKLRGEFNLIRMKGRDRQWLLVKSKDEFAEPGWKLETILKGAKRTKKRGVKMRTGRAGKKSASVSKSEERVDLRPIEAARAFEARKLSGNVNVKVKRSVVALTNLDKVYWPDEGFTKGDLIKYYYEIAPQLLPYLKDRPLILKRFPEGITADFFYQHDVDKAPDYIRTLEVEAKEGHHVEYIIGGALETLLYTANLGAIEQHPWHSRVRHLDRPDWIVFDLDPGEGVRYSTVCEVALSVRDLLERMSLVCYPKTSGARGMHIYIPIKSGYSYEQVALFAEQVADMVAGENPAIATTERSLKDRKRGQVYVDHMQNARGKSVVAPYSARPKPGATVAAPLNWAEVKRQEISPQDFTIKNMVRRVERKGDLFAPVLSERQNLSKAMGRR